MSKLYEAKRAVREKLLKQRRVIDEKLNSYQPVRAVTLDFGVQKKKYTTEENYRAFKLFSSLDVNHDRTISLQEINCMLMGDIPTSFLMNFDHPDTGIIWGLDMDDCVIIDSIESHSPASLVQQLINGLRLTKINDFSIPSNHKESLQDLLQYIIRLPHQPIELEFVEPVLTLTPFSHVLDIQIEDMILSTELPIGAVYDLDAFQSIIQSYLLRTHPIFEYMTVGIVGSRRQIFFKSTVYPFRLLFATGPNYHRSCRFALGFGAIDYPSSNYHSGQTMTINLDLGLSEEQLSDLTKELFQKFDKDESGQLDFEEFRDFYVRFFDNDQSIELLKQYALYRYRDKELEAWWIMKTQEKRDRNDRKKLARERNSEIIKHQQQKFFQESEICSDERTRILLLVRCDLLRWDRWNLVLESISEMNSGNMLDESLSEEGSDMDKDDSIDGKDDSIDQSLTQGEEDIYDAQFLEDNSRIGIDSSVVKNDYKLIRSRLKNKVILHQQAQKRKKRIRRENYLLKVRSQLEKENSIPREHMVELEIALRMSVARSLKISDTPNAGVQRITIDFRDLIATPALIIDDKLLSVAYGTANTTNPILPNHMLSDKTNPLVDLELGPIQPTEAHPAIVSYYMIKDKSIAPEFDSTVRHPAYFGADYIRGSHTCRRHAANAIAICKILENDRLPGIEYRERHGLYRVTAIPSEEIHTTKKAVTFLQHHRQYRSATLDNRIVTNIVAGRVTIQAISLQNLPNMHLFVPNSPFVTISCYKIENNVANTIERSLGTPIITTTTTTNTSPNKLLGNIYNSKTQYTYKASTELNYHSGKRSDWDELDWQFPIEWGDMIKIEIYSTAKNMNEAKLIASIEMSAEDLIHLPVDQNGYMNWSIALSDSKSPNILVGDMNIHIRIERGDQWDWHMNEYKHQQELEKQNYFIRTRLLATNEKEQYKHEQEYRKLYYSYQKHIQTNDITYPIHIQLMSIGVFDIQYSGIQLRREKNLYVKVECGSWKNTTDKTVSVIGLWDDLKWYIELFTPKTHLSFIVYDGSTSSGKNEDKDSNNDDDRMERVPLGRFITTSHDILRLPRDDDGYFQVYGTLTSNGNDIGHITIHIRLANDDFILAPAWSPSNPKHIISSHATSPKSGYSNISNELMLTPRSFMDSNVSQYSPRVDENGSDTSSMDYSVNPSNMLVAGVVRNRDNLNNTIDYQLLLPIKICIRSVRIIIESKKEFLGLNKEYPVLRIVCGHQEFHKKMNLSYSTNIYLWTCEDIDTTYGITNQTDTLFQVYYENNLVASISKTPKEIVESCGTTYSIIKEVITIGRKLEMLGNMICSTIPSKASISIHFQVLSISDSTVNIQQQHIDSMQQIATSTTTVIKNRIPGYAMATTNLAASSIVSYHNNNTATPALSPNKNGLSHSEDFLSYGYLEKKPFPQSTIQSIDERKIPYRLTILSILATNLISAHMFRRNSPRVHIAIGQVANQSITQRDGGQAGLFEGLNWNYNIIDQIQRIYVSVWSNNVSLGQNSIDPKTLCMIPMDGRGISEIYVDLQRGNISSGQVRISYIIESIDLNNNTQFNHSSTWNNLPFPLFSNLSQSHNPIDQNNQPIIPPITPNTLISGVSPYPILSGIGTIGSSAGIVNTTTLSPPLIVTIYTISAIDLVPVHRFVSNHPYIKVTCGSWFKTTNRTNSSDIVKTFNKRNYKWENIHWSVVLEDPSSSSSSNQSIYSPPQEVLKISILSYSIVIGTISLTTSSLLSAPIDSMGLTEIDTILYLDTQSYPIQSNDENSISTVNKPKQEYRGRIRIVCRLDPYIPDESVVSTSNKSPRSITSLTPKSDRIQYNIRPALANDWKIKFQSISVENLTLYRNESNQSNQPNQSNAILSDSIVQSSITSHSIESKDNNMEIPTILSPYVRIEYRDYVEETSSAYLSGNFATWSKLSGLQPMILSTQSPFRVMVFSGSEFIGATVLTLEDILDCGDKIRYDYTKIDDQRWSKGPIDIQTMIIDSALKCDIFGYGQISGQVTFKVEATSLSSQEIAIISRNHTTKSNNSNNGNNKSEFIENDSSRGDYSENSDISYSSYYTSNNSFPTNDNDNSSDSYRSNMKSSKSSYNQPKITIPIDETDKNIKPLKSSLKRIGNNTSLSNPSIQNYIETKVDIPTKDTISVYGSNSAVKHSKGAIIVDVRRKSSDMSRLAAIGVYASTQVLEGGPMREDLEKILLSKGVLDRIRMIEKLRESDDLAYKPYYAITKPYTMLSALTNMIPNSIANIGVSDIATIKNNSMGGSGFVVIRHISCWDLVNVHKAGKNSPMVKIESDRWKQQTKTLSYGGNHAYFQDLNWHLPLVRMTPLKILVTSGLALIGTAKLNIETIQTIPNVQAMDIDGNYIYEMKLTTNSNISRRSSQRSSRNSLVSIGNILRSTQNPMIGQVNPSDEVTGYIRFVLNYGPIPSGICLDAHSDAHSDESLESMIHPISQPSRLKSIEENVEVHKIKRVDSIVSEVNELVDFEGSISSYMTSYDGSDSSVSDTIVINAILSPTTVSDMKNIDSDGSTSDNILSSGILSNSIISNSEESMENTSEENSIQSLPQIKRLDILVTSDSSPIWSDSTSQSSTIPADNSNTITTQNNLLSNKTPLRRVSFADFNDILTIDNRLPAASSAKLTRSASHSVSPTKSFIIRHNLANNSFKNGMSPNFALKSFTTSTEVSVVKGADKYIEQTISNSFNDSLKGKKSMRSNAPSFSTYESNLSYDSSRTDSYTDRSDSSYSNTIDSYDDDEVYPYSDKSFSDGSEISPNQSYYSLNTSYSYSYTSSSSSPPSSKEENNNDDNSSNDDDDDETYTEYSEHTDNSSYSEQSHNSLKSMKSSDKNTHQSSTHMNVSRKTFAKPSIGSYISIESNKDKYESNTVLEIAIKKVNEYLWAGCQILVRNAIAHHKPHSNALKSTNKTLPSDNDIISNISNSLTDSNIGNIDNNMNLNMNINIDIENMMSLSPKSMVSQRRKAMIAEGGIHTNIVLDSDITKELFIPPPKFRSQVVGLSNIQINDAAQNHMENNLPNDDDRSSTKLMNEIEIQRQQTRDQVRRDHWIQKQSYLGNHDAILSDVCKGLYIPHRIRVTIHSITGLDIAQGIVSSLLPKRPYITACKPYGNWAAETGPMNKHKTEDLIHKPIGWEELNTKYHWEPFELHEDQYIVLDIRDQVAGGLIAAKCTLRFSDLFKPNMDLPTSLSDMMSKGIGIPGISGSNISEDSIAIVQTKFFVSKEYSQPLSTMSDRDIHPIIQNNKSAIIVGNMRIGIDFSVDTYTRPIRSDDYWNKMRVQHWRSYPLTPTATGIVRQRHLEISQEYDKQMIINPVFYGFQVRWKSRLEDESRFQHPVFWGYGLNRRPAVQSNKSMGVLSSGSRNTGMGYAVDKLKNKFQYDPYEKAQGRCPVCREGIDGCPRCYMIPTTNSKKEPITRDNFAFDPIRDKRTDFLKQQKEIKANLERIRNKRMNSLLHISQGLGYTSPYGLGPNPSSNVEDDTVSLSTIESISAVGTMLGTKDPVTGEIIRLHTNLTTYSAIRLYRNLLCEFVTIYIKVMPTGAVHKVMIDPHRDSTFHLYHMFHSHSTHTNLSKAPMLILPTAKGYFELTNTMYNGSNVLLPDYSGRMLLSRYGIYGHRQKVLLLYFFNYNSHSIQTMISSYIEHNIASSNMNNLSTSAYDISNSNNSNSDNTTDNTSHSINKRNHIFDYKNLSSDKSINTDFDTKSIESQSISSFLGYGRRKRTSSVLSGRNNQSNPTHSTEYLSKLLKDINIKDLPVHSTIHTLATDHLDLPNDPIQQSLLTIVRVQYSRQREEIAKSYEELGKRYWSGIAAKENATMALKVAEREEIEKDYRDAKRRILSQAKAMAHRRTNVDQFIGIARTENEREDDLKRRKRRQYEYIKAALLFEEKRRERRLKQLEGVEMPYNEEDYIRPYEQMLLSHERYTSDSSSQDDSSSTQDDRYSNTSDSYQSSDEVEDSRYSIPSDIEEENSDDLTLSSTIKSTSKSQEGQSSISTIERVGTGAEGEGDNISLLSYPALRRQYSISESKFSNDSDSGSRLSFESISSHSSSQYSVLSSPFQYKLNPIPIPTPTNRKYDPRNNRRFSNSSENSSIASSDTESYQSIKSYKTTESSPSYSSSIQSQSSRYHSPSLLSKNPKVKLSSFHQEPKHRIMKPKNQNFDDTFSGKEDSFYSQSLYGDSFYSQSLYSDRETSTGGQSTNRSDSSYYGSDSDTSNVNTGRSRITSNSRYSNSRESIDSKGSVDDSMDETLTNDMDTFYSSKSKFSTKISKILPKISLTGVSGGVNSQQSTARLDREGFHYSDFQH